MENKQPSQSHGKSSSFRGAKKLNLGKKIVDQDKTSSEQSLIDHPVVAINILPFLDVWDVLSFGSCSKSLHAVCESEETWKQLFERRWSNQSRGRVSSKSKQPSSHVKGWKALYISKHMTLFIETSKLLVRIEEVMGFMLDADKFLFGVDEIKHRKLTYEDVYFYFFRKELNVFLIMVGLYIAFFCWDVSVVELKKDLVAREVAEKKVSMRWRLPVSDLYRFYMQEEKYMEVFSLEEIVEREMSVFYAIRRFSEDCQPANILIEPCEQDFASESQL